MSNNNSNGIGFFGMLGVLFIGLKLTGFINWSWWYVTMPLWGALVAGGVVLGVFAIVAWRN